jgi:hypothetical protein
MPTVNLNTVWAHAVAYATAAAGFVIGVVPGWRGDEQYFITGGGVVIAAVIIFAHALRNAPTGQLPTATALQAAATVVQDPEASSEADKLLADAGAELARLGAKLANAHKPAETPAPAAAPQP